MRFSKAIAIGCISLLLASAAGWGDVLLLADGERLSGTMDRIEEGVLVFHTSLSGKIMAPVDTVTSLANEANFMVTTTDGRAYYGHFVSDETTQRFQPLDGSASFDLQIVHVAEAIKLPGNAAANDSDAESSWNIEAGTGVSRHFADKDATNAYTHLRIASPETGTGQLSGEARLEAGSAEDAVTAYRFELDAAGGDGAVRPFVNAEALGDDSRALDLRTGLTLGLSHTFAAGPTGALDARAGVYASRERWDDGLRRESDSDIAGRLELRYKRAFLDNGQWTWRVAVMPSLTSAGGLLAESRTAFSMPVWRSLRLRLGMGLDYDGQPGLAGVDRWSAAVDAGLSFEF